MEFSWAEGHPVVSVTLPHTRSNHLSFPGEGGGGDGGGNGRRKRGEGKREQRRDGEGG